MRAVRIAIVTGCVASMLLGALIVAMDNPHGSQDDPLDFIEHHFHRLWRAIVPGERGCVGYNRVDPPLQALATQVRVFQAVNGRFPGSVEGLSALVAKPLGSTLPKWKPLMLELPADPWGRPYQYRCPAIISKEPFEVFSLGPDGAISADDIGNW